jgi:alpha-glucoside transport system permease protein
VDWLYSWAHSGAWEAKISFAVIAGVAVLAVLGLLLMLVDRAPKTGREKWQAFMFLLPALILVLIGLLIPIIHTAIESLTTPGGKFTLSNYSWAIGNHAVRLAFRNTVLWTLIAPVLSTGIGLLYATLIDGMRGESIAKALIFVPTAISFVGAAVIWTGMYQEGNGLVTQGFINWLLHLVGIGQLGFPTSSPWNTFLIIIVFVWIECGLATVILSASIKAVPTELLEAARIDGASFWQAWRKVTVPQIRPSLIVVYVTISVASLKVFDLIFAFSGQQFGADTLANNFYTTFTQSAPNSIGEHRGLTVTMLIFILVIPFVAFQVRQMVKERSGR